MDPKDIVAMRQKIISALASARVSKGISQQELASAIGTQRSNISRMESGEQNITLDMLIRVTSALGEELPVLIEGAGPGSPEKSTYSLRLYDEDLISFSLITGGLAGLRAEIINVNEARKQLLPLDLELTGEGVVSWLRKRVIPKNRAFVEEILTSLGLSHNNTKGIIDVCKGLSLNDSYWVVPYGFDGKFSRYNLYENRFSTILSLVAYTGTGRSNEAFSTSPELTTQGMLRKAWRFMDSGEIYLYKGGSEGGANTGNEPYSEFYACQIAEKMGLDAVHYDLEMWKGILASKCRLFTGIDTSYIPAGRLVRTGGLEACLKFYEELGPEAAEAFKSMLVFDAVIYNEDRHMGNFGVLRDNRSGRITGPAPVFDNGMSLFNYAMPEDIENLAEYAKSRSNPYGIPYETICREVMGPVQRKQLRRILNFGFERHESINLPEQRLRAIEKQLSERVREILSI